MAFGDLTTHKSGFVQTESNFAMNALKSFRIVLNNNDRMTVPMVEQDNKDVAGVVNREHRPNGDFSTLI